LTKEILDQLQRMLQKTLAIQSMDISPYQKNEAIRMMKNSLDFVIEQTSPVMIDKLVYQEFKKRRMGSLE